VFAPYGPLEDKNRFIPQLLQASLTGSRLALTPGEQVRDYIFIEDVAGAFVKAALHDNLPRRTAIYNVCSGAGYTLRQVAAVAERALERKFRLDWGCLPYRHQEIMRLVGSNKQIRDDLGWQPKQSLYDGLLRTRAWLEADVHTSGSRPSVQCAS
jgi:nucleoside-diphosphate-sugar epimerase